MMRRWIDRLLRTASRIGAAPAPAEAAIFTGPNRPPRWPVIDGGGITRPKTASQVNGQASPVQPFLNHVSGNTDGRKAA